KDAGQGSKPPNFIGRVFGHIEAAPILTFSSGRPVNVLTGVDLERSRAYPFTSRPAGVGRNTFHTPRFANVDLRVVKYIPYGERRRLDFVGEAFNFFNHPNIVGVNPFVGSSFGAVTALAAPRQLRFSVDFEF